MSAIWIAFLLTTIDGDTFRARIQLWPGTYAETAIRIRNIDTPELHGHCDRERKLAMQATGALERLLKSSPTLFLSEVAPDKYGNRYLATVSLTNHVDVAGEMLKRGFAVSYDGKGPRRSWCAP